MTFPYVWNIEIEYIRNNGIQHEIFHAQDMDIDPDWLIISLTKTTIRIKKDLVITITTEPANQ